MGECPVSFLLRSVFWLVLAFLVIQPHDIDLGSSAQQLGDTALATGRSAALGTLHEVACDSFECAGAKLIVEAALTPQRPVEATVLVANAPYPAAPINRQR